MATAMALKQQQQWGQQWQWRLGMATAKANAMATAKAMAQAKAMAMATMTAMAKDRRLSLLLACCTHDGKGLETRLLLWPSRRWPCRALHSCTACCAPPWQRRAPRHQPGLLRSPTRSTWGGVSASGWGWRRGGRGVLLLGLPSSGSGRGQQHWHLHRWAQALQRCIGWGLRSRMGVLGWRPLSSHVAWRLWRSLWFCHIQWWFLLAARQFYPLEAANSQFWLCSHTHKLWPNSYYLSMHSCPLFISYVF